ncbi:MAG: HAMP domain-containing histidine kinase [Acidobacteriota bacterium]|nr:HAMP domain-containing histidine kinase [Acidobacteriota bacterium]
MNPLRSFRLRLVFGLFLGAMGLLALTHIATVLFIRKYRMIVHADTAVLVGSVALLFLIIGLLQIRRGLSPFDRLRARLAAVRQGRGRHVDGSYPTEVQPLVNDLNELLDHREAAVRKAHAKAGDLAHGLKTPLALLAQEADRAEASGNRDLADAIRQQIERMNRQVDYHLVHARAAGSGAAPGARCLVSASAEGLARTMLRLHAGRGVAVDVRVPTDHAFRGEAEDLDEMLGNVLDNACKWARSRVTVASEQAGGRVAISVEDDGPGLDPAMWERVLQRGVRADEAAAGSGFGLAIVRELAELYGGSISLDRSAAGGMRARLDLPAVEN